MSSRSLVALLVVVGLCGCPGTGGPSGPPGQVLVIDGGVVRGPPGASVIASAIDAGSAACLSALCNGAQGVQGPAGAQGPPGLQGVVRLLDGGVVLSSANLVTFVGLTTATFTGNLGGDMGASARCSAEFPGSALCIRADDDTSNTSVGPAAAGAWVDDDRSASGQRAAGNCDTSTSGGAWTYGGPATSSSGQSASVITANGTHASSLCDASRQLACYTRR